MKTLERVNVVSNDFFVVRRRSLPDCGNRGVGYPIGGFVYFPTRASVLLRLRGFSDISSGVDGRVFRHSGK